MLSLAPSLVRYCSSNIFMSNIKTLHTFIWKRKLSLQKRVTDKYVNKMFYAIQSGLCQYSGCPEKPTY